VGLADKVDVGVRLDVRVGEALGVALGIAVAVEVGVNVACNIVMIAPATGRPVTWIEPLSLVPLRLPAFMSAW